MDEEVVVWRVLGSAAVVTALLSPRRVMLSGVCVTVTEAHS
jgi:fumarate reductase subunit D